MTEVTSMTDKQFFDWLRQQQSSGILSQEMVDGANELLALMPPTELKAILTKVNGWSDDVYLNLSQQGSQLLSEFEGFRPNPYLDQTGKATIGFGSTYYEDGRKVSMSDPAVTRSRAYEIKRHVVSKDFAPAVNMLFNDEIDSGKITQNMFDALVSLTYNIGTAGLKGSSVYKHIKDGNFEKAGDAFLAWNKSRNRYTRKLEFNQGLYNRRLKEKALFMS